MAAVLLLWDLKNDLPKGNLSRINDDLKGGGLCQLWEDGLQLVRTLSVIK